MCTMTMMGIYVAARLRTSTLSIANLHRTRSYKIDHSIDIKTTSVSKPFVSMATTYPVEALRGNLDQVWSYLTGNRDRLLSLRTLDLCLEEGDKDEQMHQVCKMLLNAESLWSITLHLQTLEPLIQVTERDYSTGYVNEDEMAEKSIFRHLLEIAGIQDFRVDVVTWLDDIEANPWKIRAMRPRADALEDYVKSSTVRTINNTHEGQV